MGTPAGQELQLSSESIPHELIVGSRSSAIAPDCQNGPALFEIYAGV